MPRARADVVNVATPPLSVPLPIGLPASKNVTVPVAVPAPGAVTEIVAVKVTAWPEIEGFTEEVTTDAVLALLTTCGFPVSDPVLPLKFPSPP